MTVGTASCFVPWPRWRRWAAAASVASVALSLGAAVLPEGARDLTLWVLLVSLTAAAVAIGRSDVAAQIFARGVVWAILAPSALITLVILVVEHSLDWGHGALAAGLGMALLFARPALSTREARAQFAPTAYRGWFLAGIIGSMSTSLWAFGSGLDALRSGFRDPMSFVVLTSSVLFYASAIGVLRMRAWGVLLGGAVALTTIAFAVYGVLFKGGASNAAIALAAAPGVLLGYPVVASWLRARGLRRTKPR